MFYEPFFFLQFFLPSGGDVPSANVFCVFLLCTCIDLAVQPLLLSFCPSVLLHFLCLFLTFFFCCLLCLVFQPSFRTSVNILPLGLASLFVPVSFRELGLRANATTRSFRPLVSWMSTIKEATAMRGPPEATSGPWRASYEEIGTQAPKGRSLVRCSSSGFSR